MYAPSVARAASSAPSARSRPRIRSRSSAAAFSVNVIVRIAPTSTPSSSTARTNRSTSTEVLPLPAPASSSRSPARRSIAPRCSSVQIIWLRQIPGYRQPSREHVCGHGVSSPVRSSAASATARAAASSSTSSSSSSVRASRSTTAFRPARLPGTRRARAGRHRRAAGRGRRPAQAEQLADREHVQRHLQLAVLAPPRPGPVGPDAAALVVADDRLTAAVGSTSTRSITPRTMTLVERQRRQRLLLVGESEPQLEPVRRPGASVRGLVLQVAPEVGLDRRCALPPAAAPAARRDRRRALGQQLVEERHRAGSESSLTGPPSRGSSSSRTPWM